MRRKAFTLVELLVVIAIIALLISILAPSLKVAKDLVKQTICATNLRGIGTPTIMYCEVNRGQMPPWTEASDDKFTMQYQVTVPRRLHYTYKLEGQCGPADIEPDTGKVRPRGTVSVLVYYGQIEHTDMLFCPAITDNQLSKAAYPDPYGTRQDTGHYGGAGNLKCSYGYNPNCTTQGVYMYTKLEAFPTNAILATEPLFNIGWGGSHHQLASAIAPTWVRGHIGSNVSARTSAEAYKWLEQTGGSAWDLWPDYLAALDYIQD